MTWDELQEAMTERVVDLVLLEASQYTCAEEMANLQPLANVRALFHLGDTRYDDDHIHGAVVVRNDSAITQLSRACIIPARDGMTIDDEIFGHVSLFFQRRTSNPVRAGRCWSLLVTSPFSYGLSHIPSAYDFVFGVRRSNAMFQFEPNICLRCFRVAMCSLVPANQRTR